MQFLSLLCCHVVLLLEKQLAEGRPVEGARELVIVGVIVIVGRGHFFSLFLFHQALQ